MSVLLVGISHRSAPVSVLEKVAITDADRPKLIDRMLTSSHVSEAMIVSTCNRVEVYAVVDAFHGGLAEVGDLLTKHSGLPLPDLTKHAYVRYSEAAAEHLFAVASGLDSMVIGEQQVLSQIRGAYASADAQQASAGRCTSWPSTRCGSASGCIRRPASIGPARRWSRWRWIARSTCSARWPGRPRWWSAPVRWAALRWRIFRGPASAGSSW